jgi:1,4-alpha-glucan branching enzyme
VAGVRFRLRDKEARSVALVGGFNGWDARADPLAGPDKNGVWEIVIPLKSGTWRYAFVVDGRWATPPEASRYEDDGFGGRHGVLEVSGG